MLLTKEIDFDTLRRLLDYSPDEGIFTWKYRPRESRTWNTQFANKRAGWVAQDGYRRIRIFNVAYLEHRLVWFWLYGRWPSVTIDHINLIRSDNRLCNLREADYIQQKHNVGLRSDNMSRLKGVRKDGFNSWEARITHNKSLMSLGRFDCPAAAFFAYCIAADKFHGEFARHS